MSSFIRPDEWCSVVLAQPNTTFANETRAGSYSSADNVFGDEAKLILHYIAEFNVKDIYTFGITTNIHESWAPRTIPDHWGARSSFTSTTAPTLNCVFKATEITADFDVTTLTWNNHAASLTLGSNKEYSQGCTTGSGDSIDLLHLEITTLRINHI